MLKWEYMVVTVEHHYVRMINQQATKERYLKLHDYLTQVGLEGWEVVITHSTSESVLWDIILKRPISE